MFHISNSSGQGKVKDAAEEVQGVKSKRKGLLQVFEELGNEEGGEDKRSRGPTFFFSFFFLTLIQGIKA